MIEEETNILDWLIEMAVNDPFVFIVIVACIVLITGIILGLIIYGRKGQDTPIETLQHLDSNIQEHYLKLNDHISKTESDRAKFFTEVQAVETRLRALEGIYAHVAHLEELIADLRNDMETNAMLQFEESNAAKQPEPSKSERSVVEPLAFESNESAEKDKSSASEEDKEKVRQSLLKDAESEEKPAAPTEEETEVTTKSNGNGLLIPSEEEVTLKLASEEEDVKPEDGPSEEKEKGEEVEPGSRWFRKILGKSSETAAK